MLIDNVQPWQCHKRLKRLRRFIIAFCNLFYFFVCRIDLSCGTSTSWKKQLLLTFLITAVCGIYFLLSHKYLRLLLMHHRNRQELKLKTWKERRYKSMTWRESFLIMFCPNTLVSRFHCLELRDKSYWCRKRKKKVWHPNEFDKIQFRTKGSLIKD